MDVDEEVIAKLDEEVIAKLHKFGTDVPDDLFELSCGLGDRRLTWGQKVIILTTDTGELLFHTLSFTKGFEFLRGMNEASQKIMLGNFRLAISLDKGTYTKADDIVRTYVEKYKKQNMEISVEKCTGEKPTKGRRPLYKHNFATHTLVEKCLAEGDYVEGKMISHDYAVGLTGTTIRMHCSPYVYKTKNGKHIAHIVNIVFENVKENQQNWNLLDVPITPYPTIHNYNPKVLLPILIGLPVWKGLLTIHNTKGDFIVLGADFLISDKPLTCPFGNNDAASAIISKAFGSMQLFFNAVEGVIKNGHCKAIVRSKNGNELLVNCHLIKNLNRTKLFAIEYSTDGVQLNPLEQLAQPWRVDLSKVRKNLFLVKRRRMKRKLCDINKVSDDEVNEVATLEEIIHGRAHVRSKKRRLMPPIPEDAPDLANNNVEITEMIRKCSEMQIIGREKKEPFHM